MVKHFVDENNIYHLVEDDVEMLTISLDTHYNNVIVETNKDRFYGPIKYININ